MLLLPTERGAVIPGLAICTLSYHKGAKKLVKYMHMLFGSNLYPGSVQLVRELLQWPELLIDIYIPNISGKYNHDPSVCAF